jgi:hypothetical protein
MHQFKQQHASVKATPRITLHKVETGEQVAAGAEAQRHCHNDSGTSFLTNGK